MRTVVIIPSRLASTRLPEKPLALIHGKTMVEHVYQRAVDANIGPVVVACCSEKIAELIQKMGGQAVLTDPDLPSGTDRVFAALQSLQEDFDCVVNLQGDLPTIGKEDLKKVLIPLQHDSNIDIATLCAPIHDPLEVVNPNVVKIALSTFNEEVARALYFSRLPIPYEARSYYHHIGVYAFRQKALERFVSLKPSPLEQQERLEQLRAMEDGMIIGAALANQIPVSVDTSNDLEKARHFLKTA